MSDSDPIKDVVQIIKDWLAANGRDGLAGYECGCGLDDFMPCGCPSSECKPAYRYECDTCPFPYDPTYDWACEREPGSCCYRTDKP